MSMLTTDRLNRWTQGTRLVALAALAGWAVFAPANVVWTAVLAAGLIGSVVVLAVLVMRVRPLHDRLLVRRVEEKDAASGGIHIPDAAGEKPTEGRLLAVGNGRVLEDGMRRAHDAHVGESIRLGRYAGTEITVDGADVVILREGEVLAIVGRG
jgi:chaperonin GroES